MPVEEANQHIPKGDRMTHAFDVIKTQHPFTTRLHTDIRDYPLERVGHAIGGFFTAGVAFLANRGHDNVIREAATITWHATGSEQALVLVTDNIIAASIALGIPPDFAFNNASGNNEPHVVFIAERSGKLSAEIGYILMPPEFMVRVVKKPVRALASIAWICSQVRDLVNGRLIIDQPYINERALAYEAHFLLEAIRRYPNLTLTADDQIALSRYPQGVLSLPDTLRYKGISSSGFRPTHPQFPTISSN